MKTLTLNIGLDTNDGNKLPVHVAIFHLAKLFTIINSRVAISPSGDDQVLIAVVETYGPHEAAVYRLASLLKQDCIAVVSPAIDEPNGELVGELIGPKADEWGGFNSSYFVPFDQQTTPETPVNGWKNKAEFVAFLADTLIPDLIESGSEATALDFTTACIYLSK